MNDEKSAALALRLVAGMFKIYGNLPVAQPPRPVARDASEASPAPFSESIDSSQGIPSSKSDGTWDALQAAGLAEAPTPEQDEQERLASHKTRDQEQEDNPWLTSEHVAAQRKADLMAEESDFPDDLVERDQDASSSIFAMTSGLEDGHSRRPQSAGSGKSWVCDVDGQAPLRGSLGRAESGAVPGQGRSWGRRQREDWSQSLDPLKRRGHVPEGEELERFLSGPLFAEKGDALPVYTRRRELRFTLRSPRNRAMLHQLHTNIRICSYIVGRPELYDWLARQLGAPAPAPETSDAGTEHHGSKADLTARTAGMSAARRRQAAAKLHKYPFGRPPTILPFDMRPSPFGRTRHLRAPRARDGHLVPAGWNESGGAKSRSRRRTLGTAAAEAGDIAGSRVPGSVPGKGKRKGTGQVQGQGQKHDGPLQLSTSASRRAVDGDEEALKEEYARFSRAQEGEPEVSVSPSDTAWSTPGTWGQDAPQPQPQSQSQLQHHQHRQQRSSPSHRAFPGPAKFSPPGHS